MEIASVLAGERWSDHPACTHPRLAEVARTVNDSVSYTARPMLALRVPDVIGLVTDDPRADARIALHCALLALPVANGQRQGALAVALRSAERAMTTLDDPLPYALAVRVSRVLEAAPHAAVWAERFARRAGAPRHAMSVQRFRRQAAPEIVQLAARGLEDAGARRDELLTQLLDVAITQCRAFVPASSAAPVDVDAARWQEACALTV